MRAKSLTPLKLRMIKIIPFILGIWAIWYWRVPIQKLMSFIGDREAIANYLQQYGAVGPVILFLILMFQVFFAFIPGHAIIISGGYIYGLMIGASITQVSTVLATQIAFYLARIAGRPFVDRLCPTHIVDKWNALAEKQGGLFFFFSFTNLFNVQLF